jgi:flavin-dependent dehydrogenase
VVTSTVDVAIVGGGPAGSAAALTLLRYSGLRVVIVESSECTPARPGEILSPGVAPLLDYLGVRDDFEEDQHLSAYGTAAAWGSGEIVSQDFIFTASGHGWHLSRQRFDAMLTRRVSELGGLLVTGARAQWCRRETSADWRLLVTRRNEQPSELKAKYVIDATGCAARVGRWCGAQSRVDDRLLALTLPYVADEIQAREHYTFIESSSNGWWYNAVLPNKSSVLVLITDAATVRDLQLNQRSAFLKQVEMTTLMKRRLAGDISLDKPRIAPIISRLLEPVGGYGWVAAGDAAASYDPLSSMGIGHALYTGIQAARVAWDEIAGGGGLLKQYAEGVGRSYVQYLRMRKRFYLLEQRWQQHPFWSRRQKAIASERPASQTASW